MFSIFPKIQDDVSKRLDELLSRQSRIDRQMNGIGRSLASLTVAGEDAKSLDLVIDNASTLAGKVSDKVRRLDEARVSYVQNTTSIQAYN